MVYKRKYNGHQRKTVKRTKTTGRRTRVSTQNKMVIRRVGGRRSKKIVRLARAIKRVNVTPDFTNQSTTYFNDLLGSTSLEANYTGTYKKWTQTCRWQVVVTNESTTDSSMCEFYLVKIMKTGANPVTIAENHVSNFQSESVLADPVFRSNCKIVKEFKFILVPGSAKMIGGNVNVRRKEDDWRDASDITNYLPRGGYILLHRVTNSRTDNLPGTYHARVNRTFITYSVD